ncbi:MAG: carboxypeptidase regulatory-like domain-containing protein [Gemmatimonadota bacterium]|nr:carboxypeptidase regulatory-like domain-containing protein [Gemmatimonadota bacterium]
MNRVTSTVKDEGGRVTRWTMVCGIVIMCCGGSGNDENSERWTTDVPLEITMPVALNPTTTGGTIQGVVVFDGLPPPVKTFHTNKNTEICGTAERGAEDALIGANRGIKNVVVSITNAPVTEMDFSVKAMVDQKGCMFTPRVVQVAVGAPMVFLNNDRIFHNIHTRATVNPPLNKAQPKFMKRLSATFSEPEIFEVVCDVHSWMKGWIVVQEHPYFAVTDENGQFTMPCIPAGIYTLRYWHETFGEQTTEVTVTDQKILTADISFSE